MRLEISSNYEKVLKCTKKEIICQYCSTKEADEWYYCELHKKIICTTCMHRNIKKCSNREHQDYKIDKIKIIEV